MTNSKRKTAGRKPAAKKTAPKNAPAKADQGGDEPQVPQADGQKLVAPMHEDAFRLAIQIVNTSDIKGGDAETIVLLKRELARVSGQIPGDPRS